MELVDWIVARDREIYLAARAIVDQSKALGVFLDLSLPYAVRTLPVMLVFWWLWFTPSAEDGAPRTRREALLAILVAAPLVMLATRATADLLLPIRARPGFDPALSDAFDGRTAMPSDHAVMWTFIALGLLRTSRLGGAVALIHVVCITTATRVLRGAHWATDVLAGYVSGGLAALLFLPLVEGAVRKGGLVPLFEARPRLGHVMLVLMTFETTTNFDFSRMLAARLVTAG